MSNPSKQPLKQYLGDSVYIDHDGYAIILTTENGFPEDPRNRIVLEPDVLYALADYLHWLVVNKQFQDRHIQQLIKKLQPFKP